jgi:hypothetical protein
MERAAHFATITAALVAIFTFGFGLLQFGETQKLARENLRLQTETITLEREVKAIELFAKYNELQKEVAGRPLSEEDGAAFWHHNLLLTLTESVFRLTEGDLGWGETVAWMLGSQKAFLERVEQGCRTFAPKFLDLMKTAAPAMKCAG